MVRKTKNRRNVSENRKKNKKRITRKRRGGKKKTMEEWKQGFWSEKPTIHAKFITKDNTGKTECGYSLYWNYHYLDEDDSIPLEEPKEGEDTGIKKTETLQLFTSSERKDLNKIKKGMEINIKQNRKNRDCKLTEKEVLELLENNSEFKEKVELEKKEVEEMIKAYRQKKELIKNMMLDKGEKKG